MDKFPEAFKRFESEMNIERAKDTDDLVKKFVAWQNRPISPKQQTALRQKAEELGLEILPRVKGVGITKRTGKTREELRKHYTQHKVKGKSRIVARIPKGMKGAGRFAKKKI